MNTANKALIKKEFRSSSDSRYQHRLHSVLLVLNGLSRVKAARLLGDSFRTVAYWVERFERLGLLGLQEEEKSGRPTKLNKTQLLKLRSILRKPPNTQGMDGEVWTGESVNKCIEKHFNISLSLRHARRILRAFEKEVTDRKPH